MSLAQSVDKKYWDQGLSSKFRDYWQLGKFSVSMLVTITVLPSLFLASVGFPDFIKSCVALGGATLSSASAGAFNQILEIEIDKRMPRTANRALASGRISLLEAIIFACLLGSLGILGLYYFASPMAALCAMAGHFFYVFIYTIYLKPRTDQNIVIGGIAGSVGPLIGWAAVSGTLAWPAWVLFILIFLWTPPHFWALAIKYREEYARVGIPMYPVTHDNHATRLMMFVYTISLLPCVLALYLFDVSGLIYLLVALPLSLKFCFDAAKMFFKRDDGAMMPFFHYSCLYILGLFLALTLDSLVGKFA